MTGEEAAGRLRVFFQTRWVWLISPRPQERTAKRAFSGRGNGDFRTGLKPAMKSSGSTLESVSSPESLPESLPGCAEAVTRRARRATGVELADFAVPLYCQFCLPVRGS